MNAVTTSKLLKAFPKLLGSLLGPPSQELLLTFSLLLFFHLRQTSKCLYEFSAFCLLAPLGENFLGPGVVVHHAKAILDFLRRRDRCRRKALCRKAPATSSIV